MPMFWTDSIVLACSDVTAATEWWIRHFDCKRVPVPDDWDATLPSDVALQLPGADAPNILLCARAEVARADIEVPEHPILFTSKLKRAHEQLHARGLAPGPIQESGGTEFFEVRDGFGNTIEIAKNLEPVPSRWRPAHRGPSGRIFL